MTLTEELGAVPPPFHSWMAPLMEDMLHDARTGLTKAVVIVPGRAVLFYGRRSMGEGLTTDKARDATFLLTGAGTWVVKLAYLTADPITIQEGRQAIAQAITDCRVKVRRPGCPCVNLLAQQPFRFGPLKGSPLKDASAKNVIDVGETKGLHHLGSPHLPWIVGSRATRVRYQWLLRCHLDLIGQMGPNIQEEVGSTERMKLA